MLTVTDVTVGYGATTILRNISFSLQQGEIGCLLGPSGCGKTSLLKIICGFIPMQSGQLHINNKLIAGNKLNTPIKERNIGMVFQDYALFPHLTIFENVAFGLHQQDKPTRSERVKECLELVGLQEYSSRMIHSLSGGQKQRIALARALAPKPELLLLDEPFSSLDVTLRESLANDVRTILKDQNTTALFVTHDQKEAFSVADTIGVFNDGELHQWGSATNLYHTPQTEFVARFVGEGTLIRKPNGNTSENKWSLIRPEHVMINQLGRYTGRVLSKQFRGSHFLYRIEVNNESFKKVTLLSFGDMKTTYNVNDCVKLNVDFGNELNVLL